MQRIGLQLRPRIESVTPLSPPLFSDLRGMSAKVFFCVIVFLAAHFEQILHVNQHNISKFILLHLAISPQPSLHSQLTNVLLWIIRYTDYLTYRTMRSTTLLLFALCMLVACEQPAPTPDASPIRAMSFNIRYNNPGDSAHAWPYRKERVASTILFNNVDVVGVQEALKEQMDELATLLPGYAWTGVGRDDGKEAGEYSAIFYRSDRFEIVDEGTFWLSKNPSIPGSKDWDAAITRVATWAQFKEKTSGQLFFHYNTHFDHRGELAREKSAEIIAHRASRAASNHPLVVTGDFNFTESAPGYSTLTASFNDAYYATKEPHHGPSHTIYGGFEVTHKAGRRIDYIFVNDGFDVLQHATLSDNWDGAYASDHLAVVATLGFKAP